MTATVRMLDPAPALPGNALVHVRHERHAEQGGVARFTIGIDTNAAMKAPASIAVPWCAVRRRLASSTEWKRIAASRKYSRPSRNVFATKKMGNGIFREQ